VNVIVAVDPDGSSATLLEWRLSLADAFTWLLQGSKAVFLFFIMFTVYKYGHIKLGRKGDKPEFATLTYFCMIFTAGTGPVLLTLSAAEPMLHQSSNFFAQAGYHSQDEVDQFAINMYVCSWGISGWLTFTVVSIASALGVHRFGLPLTLRSCFYPIFGAYTWGWIGDVIDGFAIVVMVFSVCCMLCMTAIQVASGLVTLGWIEENASQDSSMMVEKTIVWTVTIISIASVFSGLQGGIKFVSLLAGTVALVLSLLVLSMDNTKFILNLAVQTVGYHLQHSMLELNFWTDAFGQLHEGSGRAIDGKAAEQWWMS
jgi:choline-glycine betaine transporter